MRKCNHTKILFSRSCVRTLRLDSAELGLPVVQQRSPYERPPGDGGTSGKWSKPEFTRKRGDSSSTGFLLKGRPGSGVFDLQINAQKDEPGIEEVLQAVP